MGATDELVAYVHFDLMWPYRLSKRILGPKGVRAAAGHTTRALGTAWR